MRTLLALAALAALLLTACGGGGASAPPSAAASAAASSAAPLPSASEAPSASASEEASPGGSAGDVTLEVADSELGEIVVDAEGRTLYIFTPDENGDPTCYDACADAWPPLLAEGEIKAGEGLDDSDFSTVTRTDGGEQVKLGDWPLYYFANDEAPGDTKGQGLNDVWFVVGPDGEPIR